VDIDQEANARFLEKFPVGGVPTLLVIDPAREQAVLTRASSVTAADLVLLLDEGERRVRQIAAAPAEVALAEGERLSGAGLPAEAVLAYRHALERGGPSWPERPRVVESLVDALAAADQYVACAELARGEAPGLGRDALFTSVVTTGLFCALQARDPGRAALEALAREALEVRALSADDRSGVYEVLVEAREAAGDAASKRQLADAWLAFLEGEAARAPGAEARAAFDAHRLAAALALGDPARALPALEASERDLPADYNPPARLALAYLELGRVDEGLAASERALARVHGPRRLRVEETRARLLVKKGDLDGARRALDGAIAFGRTLPPSERSRRTLERLESARRQLP
jgi:tetratricopeptide (TPR) repeat protein